MSVSTPSRPKAGDRMTFQEFKALNLPEASSLYLLNGVVYDEAESCEDENMTKRNYHYARVESRLSYLLHRWRDSTKFECQIFSGEVGCEAPESGLDVGIDVAVFKNDTIALQEANSYIQGAPLLAMEILSPSDKQASIKDKIDGYINAGVPLVWMVDPHFQTVVVHRPNSVPEMFASGARLNGGQSLPGLSIEVTEIFEH